MAIDMLVFRNLAVRADLIEAVEQAGDRTRIWLTTGRSHEIADDFSVVIAAMKGLGQDGSLAGLRHSAPHPA